MPPTARSLVLSSASRLPGSTVSGEYASENSPGRSPDFSSTGASTSTVVPGGTVDSSTTVSSSRRMSATVSPAAFTYEISARPSSSGVGTQIRWYSATTGSLETDSEPESADSTNAPRPGSSTGTSPAPSRSIKSSSTSYPVTV